MCNSVEMANALALHAKIGGLQKHMPSGPQGMLKAIESLTQSKTDAQIEHLVETSLTSMHMSVHKSTKGEDDTMQPLTAMVLSCMCCAMLATPTAEWHRCACTIQAIVTDPMVMLETKQG